MPEQSKKLVCCLLVSGLLAAGLGWADEAEDKAVAFFTKKMHWTIKRDDKVQGQPVVFMEGHYFFPPTDELLKNLAGLTGLKELRLINAIKVTDVGIKEVAKLKGLQKLRLGHVPLTDRGLRELATLQNLEELQLTSAKVTDVGLKHLTAFKKLQVLGLGCPDITDAGLKHLAGLKDLKALSLSNTRQVTDAGLNELTGLQKLGSLSLFNTHVTSPGIQEFKKALPKCKVNS